MSTPLAQLVTGPGGGRVQAVFMCACGSLAVVARGWRASRGGAGARSALKDWIESGFWEVRFNGGQGTAGDFEAGFNGLE